MLYLITNLLPCMRIFSCIFIGRVFELNCYSVGKLGKCINSVRKTLYIVFLSIPNQTFLPKVCVNILCMGGARGVGGANGA